MSQTLNYVPAFDGTNYGYWKARMRFFLKSIDCWGIVETGWKVRMAIGRHVCVSF
jgi:hypothetical protein